MDNDYKDKSLILMIIGVPILLVGITAAFLGPVEMYCFYLFSEGGPFHYAGFGFGSFMFGNIALQIIGYYVIAALCIPLGYAHLKARRWARTLFLTLFWSWLVVGAPLALVFFFILVTAKELSLSAVLIAAVLVALSYPAIPACLIRFYGGRNVRLTLEHKDPKSCWIESVPLPILVIGFLLVFYAIVLHIPIFFNGVFPLFGVFVSGLEGIFLIAVSILYLVFMTWGTLRSKVWAWWGALVYLGLLTFSSILTLLRSSYQDILTIMAFPPREIEMLGNVPAQGFHFAILIGLPLLLTLVALVVSRRYFGTTSLE